MPRPRRIRRIRFQPDITMFRPKGARVGWEEIILTYEEVEAVRLIDIGEKSQAKAAKQMKISQPTLSRLLSSARKKLAKAVVNGKIIRIQGGEFKMVAPRRGQNLGQGRGMRKGAGGRGLGGGQFAAGPGGNCVCPKCGHKEPHTVGTPCYEKKCPKCGTKMTRG